MKEYEKSAKEKSFKKKSDTREPLTLKALKELQASKASKESEVSKGAGTNIEAASVISAGKLSTKEKIRQMLAENQGKYLSGEEIANSIFVTRACVWKNIKSLQNEGLEIDAVTNKGYRLRIKEDIPNCKKIREILATAGIDMTVDYYEEVTSTNELLKEYAKSERRERIIIAGTQTAGKGRKGRSFYSPANTGLYFSILIYPERELDKIAGITAMAAVATATAIDEIVFNGKDTAKIKWVNDIFINGKKAAGILTEGFTSFEGEQDNYIIVGIGINLYHPENDFPSEIKDVAGCVIDGNTSFYSENSIKDRLVAKITEKIINYYRRGQATGQNVGSIAANQNDGKTVNQSGSKADHQNDGKTDNQSGSKADHHNDGKTVNQSGSKADHQNDGKTVNQSDSKADGPKDKRTYCLDIYRKKSTLIGSYVKINSFGSSYSYAKVLGITDDFHLKVQYDDGLVAELTSGEVSVVKY